MAGFTSMRVWTPFHGVSIMHHSLVVVQTEIPKTSLRNPYCGYSEGWRHTAGL